MNFSRHSPFAADVASVPAQLAASPYQFKNADTHSSHCLILRLLGEGRGRNLLDVGAAHGYLAGALRSRGFKVTGIEGNPVLGEEAAKHCDEFFLLDLDAPLPILPQAFDVMVFGDVLEHLKDPLRVLQTLLGSLKDDGLVLISLPNIANFYIRFALLFGRFDYQDRGILDRTHLRFFTRQAFQEFLSQAGLDVLQLTATPVPLPLVIPKRFQNRLFWMIHGFSAWLARSWQTMFAYQFIAVARKAAPHAA